MDKVKGYRPLTDFLVDQVNKNKVTEEQILSHLDTFVGDPQYDQRWLAVARTHLEQGFMAFNRAIFRPQRVKDDSQA